jgi:DNA topoisomerase-1
MALAQRLYEGVRLDQGGRIGLITYPRTGSCRVSPAADLAVRALVSRSGGTSPAACAEEGTGAASGHEALRPASLDWPPGLVHEALRVAGGRDLVRVYALIWARFIESRSGPAVGLERSMAPVAAARLRPARLDDATLIETLASRGVGRPSTLATIGESLEARGYLERTGGALQVAPLGHRVVAWLDRTFPRTLDAEFTAGLESRLDEVEAGVLSWRVAVATAWRPLEQPLARVVA